MKNAERIERNVHSFLKTFLGFWVSSWNIYILKKIPKKNPNNPKIHYTTAKAFSTESAALWKSPRSSYGCKVTPVPIRGTSGHVSVLSARRLSRQHLGRGEQPIHLSLWRDLPLEVGAASIAHPALVSQRNQSRVEAAGICQIPSPMQSSVLSRSRVPDTNLHIHLSSAARVPQSQPTARPLPQASEDLPA